MMSENPGINPIKLHLPFTGNFPVTQSFSEHLQKAQQNGWCWKPGSCPSKIYYYPGIDWGMPLDTPISAAADGVVVKCTQSNQGYGNHILIQHNKSWQTLYAHLNQIFVKSSQKVKAQEIIGKSGSTGNSTGPHLHFELRQEGIPTDPSPFLIAQEIQNPIPAPIPDFFPQPSHQFFVSTNGWGLRIRLQPSFTANHRGLLQDSDVVQGWWIEGEWIPIILWVHKKFLIPKY